MKLLYSILIICTIATLSLSQVDIEGARAIGMGGAYSASATDGLAPAWNPGAMDAFRVMALNLSYSAYHIGITDDYLHQGAAGYVLHLDRKFKYGSIGIGLAQFLSGVYSQGAYSIGYSKRLWGQPDSKCLSLGAMFVLWNSGFNSSGFSEFNSGDPVIRGKTGSMVYSVDAGAFLRPSKTITAGISAKNLTQPDVSISQNGSSKLPIIIRGGLAFNFDFLNPALEVEYSLNAPANKNLGIHIGAQKSFSKNFAIRAGWNRNDISIGAGYFHPGEKYGWGIDYAITYPMATQIAKDYLTTHRIGFDLTVQPPPVPIEDLAIVKNSVQIIPNKALIGEEVTITAKIENKGEIPENKVGLTIYYQNQIGEWVFAAPPQKVNIGTGEVITITQKWVPPARGNYAIYVAIDDDGKKLPAVHGKIEESDEDNNIGYADLTVFKKPEGTIEPKNQKLAVSKLLLYQEEEPIVPMVFFGANSATVDPRFDRMMKIISSRMANNPNVVLEVKGYYDRGSDDVNMPVNLALERARAVKKRLIELGVPGERITVAERNYDMSSSRAGIPEEQVILRDRQMMHEENRRVEITAWFETGSDFLARTTVRTDGTFNQDDLLRWMPHINQLLSNNEEVIIICEGHTSVKDKSAGDIAFENAAKIANWLKEQVGSRFAERIYVHQSITDEIPTNEVWVFPTPEGVVYRPREADRVLEVDSLIGEEENLVTISAEVDAGVDSFSVSIINTEGKTVRTLAEGKGQIPKGLAWDWTDETGTLLDFDEKYFAKLQVWDKMGEQLVTHSDTMAIEIVKTGKRIEALIIVMFLFNQDNPQSKFLESRIEYVARKLIHRAQKEQAQIIATVTGHTDSIGPEYANLSLSTNRANQELNNIKRYLKYLLRLDSEADVDKWLEERHVTIRAKGFGESKPYTIYCWDPTTHTSVKYALGNNHLPEGRILNRRVMLEIESQKLAPGR